MNSTNLSNRGTSQLEVRENQRGKMSPLSPRRMTVTEVGEFLRGPPAGFSVETIGSHHRVHSDDDTNLVLIDDFQFCSGKITFQNSLGRCVKPILLKEICRIPLTLTGFSYRKVKMRNLWEYSRVRQSLLTKRIYLLVTACNQTPSVTKKKPRDLRGNLLTPLGCHSLTSFTSTLSESAIT